MNENEENVYCSPQCFGLAVVAELEDPEACYTFNTFVAWQHEDGRLFWSSDTGCSCPAPFEDVVTLDDLTTGTAEELTADALSWVNDVSEYAIQPATRETATADAHGLIRKVKALGVDEARVLAGQSPDGAALVKAAAEASGVVA